MTKISFKIQGVEFPNWTSNIGDSIISVKSSPRPYTVSIVSDSQNFAWLEKAIRSCSKPLIIADEFVLRSILNAVDLSGVRTFSFPAIEDNKDIMTVLKACDFLNQNQANRGSMVFVIGGGIVQDIGAFACAMLKRGIPWTYIPTTMLSQGDSCLGGKTAVNHNKTKNLLGLFSAPRAVVIDTNFAKTLTHADRMSGGGEIFRLLITGGPEGFELLSKHMEGFVAGEEVATQKLVEASLQVKKLIVEYDEFELDVRRSMNYGHSIGHAIEALSDYKIPHGLGVAIGILVENRIAVNRGMLSEREEASISELGRKLIPSETWNIFKSLDIQKILPLLASDKKVEGSVLKLATINRIGDMIFIDLPMDKTGLHEVTIAFNQVIEKII